MKDFLTVKQVAEMLAVSTRSIERWIEKGIMPGYYQVDDRSPRFWDPKDIKALIKKSKRAA